ncbi:serine-protein kinase ATM isoform X1 [Osmerus mordax]|uniref:serine-protein kinase ATM isoform X1 n=1 Tax=Osmerus mordax TaxID=8014 RepID=UPI00351096A9
MSLALHELLLCCRGLENDKATERKREVDTFKRLIRSSDTVEELDRSSGTRAAQGSRQLTWDAVFRFLQKYLQKETELLKGAKANVTATTLTIRQKKMREISSLVKYFIRSANKRGPRLKCSEVLNHVMEVLGVSFSCSAYGEDYSSILLKDFLSVRKYWCELTHQQWHSLLELYCGLFTSTTQAVNRVLLSRIIHTAVLGCCVQTDGMTNMLFSFFSKALLNARHEKHLAVVEHLVAALNVFLRSAAMNCRMRVCRLGEELLPSALYVWTEMRPSSALKEELVELFNLQLCVHHPHGAKTPDTGAHAEDWSRWPRLLYNLYDALVREISHIGSRGKYATGSRHIAVKDNLIELTADICHQLFSEDPNLQIMEVTQAYLLATQKDSPQGTPSKRRRIELGWEVLRNHLQPNQNDFDIVPWLQITSVLTSKYPSMVPSQELVPLLSLLLLLLGEQKRGERGPYVLRCLREVARCQADHPERSQACGAELGRLWARVWALALRAVSSPHTEALSLELLATVVQGGLIPTDREFWKLFSGSACKPSPAATLCLAQALLKGPVPKSLGRGWEPPGPAEGCGPPSLKESIRNWLLMSEQNEDAEESFRPHPIICRDLPHNLVPRILVALTLKDTRAGMRFLSGAPQPESALTRYQVLPGADATLKEVESLYLQFTFNDVTPDLTARVQGGAVGSAEAQLTVVAGLKDQMEKALLAVADNLLNCFSPDSLTTPPECVLRCCALLTGLLAGYVSTGVLSEEDACHSQLFLKAKSLAQDFSEYVSTVKVKMAEDGTMATLRSIMRLCTVCVSRGGTDKMSAVASSLFAKILSARLLNELAEICKLLLVSQGKAGSAALAEEEQGEEEWAGIRTQAEPAPEDIDLFDDGDGAHASARPPLRSGGDASQDGQSGPGAKSPLAEEGLLVQDWALLETLETLAACASAGFSHGLAFKPSEVRHRLLLLVEHVDFTKPLHLRMYLVLLTKLPSEDASLPPEEFDTLLRPLADLCSLYRQDQEVCAAVLLGLLPSIRSLGRSENSAHDMRHVQGSLLQVLSGFCLLGRTGKCTGTVRSALVRCLLALLEADPGCKWAVLTLREEEQAVSELLPSSLADSHHHVRMLAATSVDRLFLEMTPGGSGKRKMLPLRQQQAAFENVYLKAQEGMRAQRGSSTEEQGDETVNHQAALLRSLSVVLCCSPVCEKQALFALFQSYKENHIEEQLIKKVLGGVSRALGYRTVDSFVCSHLDFLVAEWLGQRQKDPRYTLESFPYTLLNHASLTYFYSCSYQVLIPHLVFLDDFEQVRSIGEHLGKDWKGLLADCFPRIMVNILPYFALSSQDAQVAQRREKAHRVYDLLKDGNCLGKQQIDSLIHSNLADIVVELLMTLYEGAGTEGDPSGELRSFIGELDPAPNPPYFSSYVIKATLDYLSKCHSTNHKSLVAILSKTPISIQRILLAVCERAAETTNPYERHRILLMYHLFVSLLLREVRDGLGGAWAFVLRDITYTLIHHINGRPAQLEEVSRRTFSLCCQLLASVCHTAVQFCDDALESHLQVIVGTLTAQVTEQDPAVSQQVLSLLNFLVVDSQDKLKSAIQRLEPFPDRPEFRELRRGQRTLKYSTGNFTLRQEIVHFLSVASCDSLPLTRLEGLKDLSRQLRTNKAHVTELLQECHAEPAESVLVQLVLNLLQLCKLAANHPGGADILEAAGSCLGELGPVDLSTIALLQARDPLHTRAASLFSSVEPRNLFIILNCMNNALTHHCIQVRKAAAQCVKNILATQSGADFWDLHKDHRDPMLTHLNPFRSARKKPAAPPAETSSEARDQLEGQELWVPQAGGHKAWLRTLCSTLLDSGGVRSEALLLSRPLCLVRTDFCQRALPLIIHDILRGDAQGSWRTLLSSHIQDFFTLCSRHAQASSRPATPLPPDSGETDIGAQGSVDKASLRTMLSVVDYLRQQQRPIAGDGDLCGTVCDSNFWLELNYLEVARAAQACSAHFTALLYAEIYVDKIQLDMEESRRTQTRASRRLAFDESSQNVTLSSLMEKSVEDTGISLQDLLIEVYRSIGEPDSLYGCGGGKMTSPLTRIRTYEHEASWGKALTSYDLHANLPEVTRQVGIVEALQNFGLSGILATYLRGLESEGVEWGAELRELRFQAAWRNMQWDCDLSESSEKCKPGFNESVYCTLQALRDKEFSTFDQTLKYARGVEVEELCRGSLEAVSSLYPALCNLQRISELDGVRQLFSRPFTDAGLTEVCCQWQQHSKLLLDSDFSLVEPILALRSVALETLIARQGDPDTRKYLSSVLTDHLMEVCQLARTAGNTQLAERAVFQMRQRGGGGAGSAGAARWQLEEAQVFWVKGEQGLALGLLRLMIHNLEGQVDFNPALVPVFSEGLRLCGTWLAETCLESPGVILEQYLEKAVEVMEDQAVGGPLQSQRTQAFLSLARFSDAQYQSMDNYMKSSEFENKQALLDKAKQEVGLMRERKVGNNRYTVKVQRELELDEQALSSLQADQRRFLCKAVENYILCLEQGQEQQAWVFRLASLWLENGHVKEVNDMMRAGIKRIPSYKFLPLMYQLAARMGTKMSASAAEDAGFHEVLNQLMCRSSLEHPHHTLFIILALVNANMDDSFSSGRLSKTASRQPSQLDLERSEVAKKIINEIRKRKAPMVRGIELLCDAYITLAYMDASRHKAEKKAIPIPADQPIMKIKDLDDVVIPTMEIRVDPSGNYDDLVTVRSFMPHYRLAGGVNLPKIIDCVGSDGKSRRQLVKGQDDLRQDAVMQQVFHMCSTLLQRNTETRKRKLNIRRYKVVPFSQRSGVLEWCSGTVPIGEFLVDTQRGAHKRFRPQDWTSMACRRKMMEAQRQGFEEKVQAFSEVCENFRPVFRFFCMERFLDPAVWLEKRLAYTRSVATSSIVGYIVGLGDRHIQNILIDEQTAELVHIDLGVAFEQGKILPTPETVPFRLSRDIVDGMGITGVEGVFRRCCEKTMEVMRSSQEALLTIVEVLLYDPLFDWTMSPLKAFYLQQNDEQAEINATLNASLGGDELDAQRKASCDSQSFNKVAERVLLRLQEKLKGVEEGAVLSVGGQVNLLIQQALDPNNLSRLFPGWQAWV